MKKNASEDFGDYIEMADEPDKQVLLQYGVYEAPDKSFWKIEEKEPGSSHPGVCWQVDVDRREAVLFKGTSQHPKKTRYLNSYAIIDPNSSNGLDLRTYFRIDEFVRRGIQKVELLVHDRSRGRLTEEDIQTIEESLNELKGGTHGR